MKVKEESEKVGLKLNIQKTKIMASGPITSWQIDGETMETVTDFIFLGSKITAAVKLRRLLLGRKAMINLDRILKSRDITLPTKVHLVKAMFFPVVMRECERWILKKAECQRIDAFELWCLRRLLRVPWTARRPNQSILKEISPEYTLEGLMLKLKRWYFGRLMQRVGHDGVTSLSLFIFSSVQFSRSVMSDSLRPHESQHARPPCPSPTPGVQTCVHQVGDSIQPSHLLSSPSPPAPNLSQHQSLFQSVMSNSVIPWTVSHQVPLSVGFSR